MAYDFVVADSPWMLDGLCTWAGELAHRAPQAKCSAVTEFAPSREQLDLYVRDHEVIVAFEDTFIAGFAAVKHGGLIKWLVVDPDHLVAVMTELIPRIVERYGACSGFVDNEAVRNAIATIPGVVMEGNELRREQD